MSVNNYERNEFDGQDAVEIERAADFAAVPDAFQRLWTPHRKVYIEDGQQPAEHDCPFCVAPTLSDEKALIVARGTFCDVLLNLYPYNSGHLLVCPYRHIALYDQANEDEVAKATCMPGAAPRKNRNGFRPCSASRPP